MAMIAPSQVLLIILTGTILAVLAGILVSWGWALRRVLAERPLLPERPLVVRRPVPWGAGTVLLVVLAYIVVNLAVVEGYAALTGRDRSRRPDAQPGVKAGNPGRDRVDAKTDHPAGHDDSPRATEGENAPAEENDREPLQPPIEPTADGERLSRTEQMFLLSAINSILLIVIPALVRLTSGARLRDFGLSLDNWPRQVAVGVVAILLILPVVYGVQTLAVMKWPPRQHPLQEMVGEHFSPEVAYLAVLSAVVLAPMLEELIFRAILQSWLVKEEPIFRARLRNGLAKLRNALATLTKRRSAPDVSFESPPHPSSPDWPSATPWPEFWEANDKDHAFAQDLDPRSHPDSNSIPILPIFLTSLIFAAVHTPQWPAPLAIFVLSMALGVVYHRTGSLLASIVMHAMFNGLSTLALFAAILSGEAGLVKEAPPQAMISGKHGVETVKPEDVEANWNHALWQK